MDCVGKRRHLGFGIFRLWYYLLLQLPGSENLILLPVFISFIVNRNNKCMLLTEGLWQFLRGYMSRLFWDIFKCMFTFTFVCCFYSKFYSALFSQFVQIIHSLLIVKHNYWFTKHVFIFSSDINCCYCARFWPFFYPRSLELEIKGKIIRKRLKYSSSPKVCKLTHLFAFETSGTATTY